MANTARQLQAVILAAGKGTRMNSDLPKVLHPVADRPMVRWVVDACEAVGVSRVVIVVGHQADRVREALADRDDCVFAEQREQLGTGHAVMVTGPLFEGVDPDTDVLVLCGDGPLIRTETLEKMLHVHRTAGADATLATSVLSDATGYGRIVRDAGGRFVKIVEHKDATPEQLNIREVNPSYYCFRLGSLLGALKQIDNRNAKGEYYITDVFEKLLAGGGRVEVIDAVPPQDVLSINTPDQLTEVDRLLRRRLGAEVQG